MASESSLNQTVQGEVGEFNYLYVNQEEVDIQSINEALTALDGRVTINETNIAALAEALGTTNDNIATLTEAVNNNIQDISDNREDILALRADRDAMREDITALDTRVTALEGASPESSELDNLSLSVQALQTRTGTLESLIGLLTNNNTNDTDIEHRITRIEKTIVALKAIHDAKKSVYNIPLDW